MEMVCSIVIATEFSDAPGARYYTDGPKSGQEFYETLLKTRFEQALDLNGYLLIDFDNVWGYPSSFIGGAFGRLSQEFGADVVLKHLQYKSDRNPLIIDKVVSEIRKPAYK